MKIVFEQPVVNVVELATGPKGDAGDTGPQGIQGPQGDQGPQGVPGPANSLAIGTVVEGPTAGATITGTSPSQTLNLVLPEADPGPPNTLTAGTVTQIPAGGQPTVSITGTAPNQTLNLGLVDGSPTAFELRGGGFPGTGTNATSTDAASPGTYYTDTLGTNGAWRWIKTSAGTGTARWVVTVGDTGPRNVNGDLLNGWVLYSTEVLTLSRENSTVTLRVTGLGLDGVAATSAVFINLPQGFRWARRTGESITTLGIARRWIPADAPTLIKANYASNTSTLALATGSGARYEFEISFKTLDPWPSTLPGIPR